MKRFFSIITFTVCCVFATAVHAQQHIDLTGSWDFAMGDTPVYNDYVMLPGSMLTNGKGRPVSVNTQWTGSLYDSSYYFNPYMAKYRIEGQMKFPFFLTPERHYTGNAWYRRSIYIPKDWSGQRITLFLERPHIETTVFVNGREVGHRMSLSVPHRYDVTDAVRLGEHNEIVIRVYNGIENVCVGQDSHSVTDQTQGNWNGIVGRIELQAQWKKLNIRGIRVCVDSTLLQLPDLVVKGVKQKGDRYWQRVGRVTVKLENHVDGLRIFPIRDYFVEFTLSVASGHQAGKVLARHTVQAEGNEVSTGFSFDNNIQMWDEFHPNLYRLTIKAGEDVYEALIGFRQLAIDGPKMLINGRRLFLRGTVENCCFPETGFPPTDEDEWMRIFRKCKEYGLNHVRFHSYCPTEAAFAAADRVGIYLQAEGPSWPNHGVKLRRGQKIDQYLMDETKRIIDEYGHHPSFCMMAAGNEPAGDWVSYCNDWVKTMKQYDPTKLYAGASVGGGWAWDNGSEYHVKAGARGLDWDKQAPHSDDDYYDQLCYPRNYKSPLPSEGDKGRGLPNTSPIVAHEQGQWCAFPDFKEMAQYTGAYKARNFEIFRDLLAANGMASQAEKFLMASGRLQTLCYKYETERNLRTKDYAGFQYLGLNDYSGQGTALVGPLNVHWREKGYCTSTDWRQFCSAIVPLAKFPKFVYTNDETLVVPVEAYNAFSTNVTDARATYKIHGLRNTNDELQNGANVGDGDTVISQGTLFYGTLPVGKNIDLGTIQLSLAGITAPRKLTLTVQFSDNIKNHWDFWVYPRNVEFTDLPFTDLPFTDLYETDTLDAQALKVLKKGGKVLLTAAGRVTLGSDVKQTYLPVFWNTSWFKMRPPHTTGAYIDKEHPLFKYGFPTDDWSNLNWWELLNKAQVMNLMELPHDYQSPIQPIDTWHVSRKLGMLIEAKVGKGRLLMTTMDITSRLDHRIVARQMRQAILAYMQSADFQPTLVLKPEVIQHFFTLQAPAVNMFTNDSPDELKPKIK